MLRNNPRWRATVHNQIPAENLTQLPEKFDAFIEVHRTSHANMDARPDRMTSFLGTIKGDFA